MTTMYRLCVKRANEIAELCIANGIRFENINMIGIKIYYYDYEELRMTFEWFKCTLEELDDAEDFIVWLISRPKWRQSKLDEF